MLKSTTQAEASNTPDTTNRIDAPDTQSVVVDAWTSLVRSKSTRNRSLSSAAAAKHDMFVSTTTAALSPSSTSDFADVTHSSTIIDDLQRQLAERDQDIELAASIGQGLLEEVAALQIKCRELEDRLVRTGATVDAGDGTVYMRDEHVENETARFETTGQHSPVHFEARGNSPRKALHRLETPGSRRRRLLDASEDIAPRTLFQSACDDTAASGAETRLVSTSQVDQLREMDDKIWELELALQDITEERRKLASDAEKSQTIIALLTHDNVRLQARVEELNAVVHRQSPVGKQGMISIGKGADEGDVSSPRATLVDAWTSPMEQILCVDEDLNEGTEEEDVTTMHEEVQMLNEQLQAERLEKHELLERMRELQDSLDSMQEQLHNATISATAVNHHSLDVEERLAAARELELIRAKELEITRANELALAQELELRQREEERRRAEEDRCRVEEERCRTEDQRRRLEEERRRAEDEEHAAWARRLLDKAMLEVEMEELVWSAVDRLKESRGMQTCYPRANVSVATDDHVHVDTNFTQTMMGMWMYKRDGVRAANTGKKRALRFVWLNPWRRQVCWSKRRYDQKHATTIRCSSSLDMCAFTVTAAGEPLMMLEGADGKEQLYFSFGSPADAAVWRETMTAVLRDKQFLGVAPMEQG